MKKSIISFVLPVFNEEDNILPFYNKLSEVLLTLGDGYDVEMIFVNDGSVDSSMEKLEGISRADSSIRILSFSRNFGHQAALTAGMDKATGDVVVTMDCDLQDPPDIIPLMLEKWREGSKVVYARRAGRDEGFFKKLTASLYYKMLSRVSDVDMPQQVGDFRLIDKKVLEALLQFDEHARYLRGMVAWLGFKHSFVEFDRPGRIHGETHYPLGKMIKLAMDGLLGFSMLPLKLALWVGTLSIITAVSFFAYMMFDYMRGTPYPLFKWLTVILFGFMGAQFILLWVVGEYIGRIYSDVRKRPLYVVEDEVNF